MYSVYILTVKDGRKYIGMTSQPPKRRWNHGNGYRRHLEFWQVICDDGWETVDTKVVADGLTKEEASRLEQELIARYHSIEPECGFNKECGGHDAFKILSDATKEKIRESMTGEKNHNYGTHFSEERKRKIAESNRGQKRSEETRRRVGKAKEKAVSQYTLNGDFLATYESGKTAAAITGVPAYSISKACLGKHLQAGGYIWKFTNE